MTEPSGNSDIIEPRSRAEYTERTPQVRCTECGSSRVAALCCKCERPMCRDHDKVADLAALRKSARSLLRRTPLPDMTLAPIPEPDVESSDSAASKESDSEGRLQSEKQPRLPQERHFCRTCLPLGGRYDTELIAAGGIAVVGSLALMVNVVVGSVLLVIALVRIVVRLLRGWRSGTGPIPCLSHSCSSILACGS